MSMSPQMKVVVSAVGGGAVGIGLCVLPAWLGADPSNGQPRNWMALGWPAVWAICIAAAGLITIPFTFIAVALAGPRYSGAAPIARQTRKEAEKLHPEPDRDRELGLLAGALSGLAVCAAVPPLLSLPARTAGQSGMQDNALANLLLTGALVAGVIAKMVYLELQMRDSTY